MIEPKHASYGLAIVNASSHYIADDGAEREEFDFDDFILLWLCGSWAQAPGQINGHGLRNEAGTGIVVQDSLPATGGVAGLLKKLAFGRGQLIFTLVNSPGAKLPQKLLGGVAILAHQQDARLGTGFVNRENYDRASVTHDVATAAYAGRLEDLIRGDPEGRPTIGLDGRKHASFIGMG